VLDADRIEQVCERDSNVGNIDLVIADAYVVIGIAVDGKDLDIGRLVACLVALARSSNRGPETGKAGAEDEDAGHGVQLSLCDVAGAVETRTTAKAPAISSIKSLVGQISNVAENPLSSPFAKNIVLLAFVKICSIAAIPPRHEGRARRHERGAGCDGR
jgi:hypothetical protein